TVSATTDDPQPGNNSDSASTTVQPPPSADLSLSKTDSPDPVTVGATLTYTLTVANQGPDDASGVSLSDPLPAGGGFLSASSSQGSCGEAAAVVTCDLGTIATGANAS